jgi:hypothetical protein
MTTKTKSNQVKKLKPAIKETTYKFRLLERALVSNLLPLQADYTTLIISGDIKDKVKFDQEDITKYGITVIKGGGINWSPDHSEEEFEYTFSELETNLIKEKLLELDAQKKLTPQHLDLFRMFAK